MIETVWVSMTWPQAFVVVILGLPVVLAGVLLVVFIVLIILTMLGFDFRRRG